MLTVHIQPVLDLNGVTTAYGDFTSWDRGSRSANGTATWDGTRKSVDGFDDLDNDDTVAIRAVENMIAIVILPTLSITISGRSVIPIGNPAPVLLLY